MGAHVEVGVPDVGQADQHPVKVAVQRVVDGLARRTAHLDGPRRPRGSRAVELCELRCAEVQRQLGKIDVVPVPPEGVAGAFRPVPGTHRRIRIDVALDNRRPVERDATLVRQQGEGVGDEVDDIVDDLQLRPHRREINHVKGLRMDVRPAEASSGEARPLGVRRLASLPLRQLDVAHVVATRRLDLGDEVGLGLLIESRRLVAAARVARLAPAAGSFARRVVEHVVQREAIHRENQPIALLVKVAYLAVLQRNARRRVHRRDALSPAHASCGIHKRLRNVGAHLLRGGHDARRR